MHNTNNISNTKIRLRRTTVKTVVNSNSNSNSCKPSIVKLLVSLLSFCSIFVINLAMVGTIALASKKIVNVRGLSKMVI